MKGIGYRNTWFSISKNCRYNRFYGFTQAVIYITYDRKYEIDYVSNCENKIFI